MNKNNRIIIIVIIVIICSIGGILYEVFYSKQNINPFTSTPSNVEDPESKIITKVDKIFNSWNSIETAEYKMSGSNGKVFVESKIVEDITNKKYERINNSVQGMEPTSVYTKEILVINGEKEFLLSNNNSVETTTSPLSEIITLTEIKNSFITKLQYINKEGVDEEIIEEKTETGLNRIKIILKDVSGTNSNSIDIYPFELVLKYTDENEINFIGLPFGEYYFLLNFEAYNQDLQIN